MVGISHQTFACLPCLSVKWEYGPVLPQTVKKVSRYLVLWAIGQ